MEYKIWCAGKEIKSRNFWDGGRTWKARMWRQTLAGQERYSMRILIVNVRSNLLKQNIIAPYEIKIIRVYPTTISILGKAQKKYDDDNLNGGCKHIRDGIANGLGYLSDSHPDLSWDCDQRKSGKEGPGVEIIISTKIEEK